MSASPTDARQVIQIGPFHPLLEEPVGFELTVEGEKVVARRRPDGLHPQGASSGWPRSGPTT